MLNDPLIQQNKITIPSRPELIRAVDDFIEMRLSEKGVDDSLIADIAICATELTNNSIIHGNKANPDKVVTLEIEFEKDIVRITISDQGEYFNPDKIKSPIEDENLLRETGRGIFIVRRLMDSVEFNHIDNGGTVVTIIKKIV